MAPIPLGAIAGLVLSSTTSFLITGRLFHPYQKKTPSTWRAESWRQHLFAMLLQAIAGAGLGCLFALAGAPPVGVKLFVLGAGVWIVLAACILILALYVNWARGFVVGLVLDWTVFIAGVLLACAWFSAGA
jgi:membrane-bound ClpP family serine protease